MTEPARSRPRVRPAFRRAAIFLCVVLVPIAAHSLWDYIEARRLSSAVEVIRQRGERLHFGKEREGRPITAEQKQASRYYGAAAHLVRDVDSKTLAAADRDIKSLSALAPAAARRDPRLEGLRQLAERYDPALELLDRASRLDARGLDYGDESRYGFPNKSLGDVNALRIARLALLGDAQPASQALVGTLRIRRAYADVFSLGWSGESDRSLPLILTFSSPSDTDLQALQREYTRWDVDTAVEDRLIDLRARLLEAVWPGVYGEMPNVPRISDLRERQRIPRLTDLAVRPWVTRRITAILAQYDEALAAARQPWPAKLDAARSFAARYPEQNLSRQTGGLLRQVSASFGWLLSANPSANEIGRLAPLIATEIAKRRVAITALAIERYRRNHAGATPESLSALIPAYLAAPPIDPFSGAPIRYVQTMGHYTVYSIGSNRTDDGGDLRDDEPEKVGPWFSRPRMKDLGFDVPMNHQ